jgi:hypothetical protein
MVKLVDLCLCPRGDSLAPALFATGLIAILV